MITMNFKKGEERLWERFEDIADLSVYLNENMPLEIHGIYKDDEKFEDADFLVLVHYDGKDDWKYFYDFDAEGLPSRDRVVNYLKEQEKLGASLEDAMVLMSGWRVYDHSEGDCFLGNNK